MSSKIFLKLEYTLIQWKKNFKKNSFFFYFWKNENSHFKSFIFNVLFKKPWRRWNREINHFTLEGDDKHNKAQREEERKVVNLRRKKEFHGIKRDRTSVVVCARVIRWTHDVCVHSLVANIYIYILSEKKIYIYM